MVSNPSHKVTITLTSKDDEPYVTMQVNWDPLLTDDEVVAEGFEPAAYKMAQNLIFAVEGMMDMAKLLEVEEGDLDSNRSLN
jgi:hypothetical protein